MLCVEVRGHPSQVSSLSICVSGIKLRSSDQCQGPLLAEPSHQSTLNQLSGLHRPSADDSMYHHIWLVYVALGIQPRVSCVPGKHSAHWVPPQVPISFDFCA